MPDFTIVPTKRDGSTVDFAVLQCICPDAIARTDSNCPVHNHTEHRPPASYVPTITGGNEGSAAEVTNDAGTSGHQTRRECAATVNLCPGRPVGSHAPGKHNAAGGDFASFHSAIPTREVQ